MVHGFEGREVPTHWVVGEDFGSSEIPSSGPTALAPRRVLLVSKQRPAERRHAGTDVEKRCAEVDGGTWRCHNPAVAAGPSSPITSVLARIAVGDSGAAEQLLPLVYEELRALARARMAHLPAGQTIQATALVHEAWVKLGGNQPKPFENRAHFFGAAARAMRNILIDQARAKGSQKRIGGRCRVELTPDLIVAAPGAEIDLLALDEALNGLERAHPRPAQVVMLRYFAGLEMPAVAAAIGVTSRTAERDWRFAKAWLKQCLHSE